MASYLNFTLIYMSHSFELDSSYKAY